MSETYQDLGGGLTDPDEPPAHAIACNRVNGMSRTVDPDDSVPVHCPRCRPWLTDHRHPAMRPHRRRLSLA